MFLSNSLSKKLSLLACFLAFSAAPSSGIANVQAQPLVWGSNIVADVAERVAPSVVSLEISAKGKRISSLNSFYFKDSRIFKIVPKVITAEAKIGDGSGFIVSPDGYIVTNQHVVNPVINGQKVKPSKIEVVMYDGKRELAEIIGEDEDTDIAVIKIKAQGLRPLNWGDSSLIRAGDFGITIGSSLGADHTVGFGVISAVSRKKPQGSREAMYGDLDYIQTYAQINPGNSGGPLLSLNGEVIGITSFIQLAPHSPGFAIPSNYAKRIATALIQDGVIKRPAMGLYLTQLQPRDLFSPKEDEGQGAYIEDIVKGGPADKAGLKAGDLIIKINDIEVKQPEDFTHSVRTSPVSTSFKVQVLRNNKQQEFNMKSEYLD